ncbi:hypothetical protein CEXT_561121 [Caerostris extrusa]|uniref:Uncharacterized protein n=1 Tax=Caerostris extrusa TaxID=172846 RepID=A0AAV4T3M7_CAEEX|nr:hypothetical protein CEXT_561121 [Caerostris extrusa]
MTFNLTLRTNVSCRIPEKSLAGRKEVFLEDFVSGRCHLYRKTPPGCTRRIRSTELRLDTQHFKRHINAYQITDARSDMVLAASSSFLKCITHRNKVPDQHEFAFVFISNSLMLMTSMPKIFRSGIFL